jgi:hypothetical protein
MRKLFKGAIAALALGGVTLAAVQPAEARDHTGAAVAAGLIGLGVGAAIASADRPRYDRYDNNGYYGGGYGGYYGGGGYYAPSYGVVYDRGGYDRGGHRGWDRHDGGHGGGWDRHDRGRDHDWRR